ncbi:MAG: hypothetical protein NT007_19020 [Candidatus Kapabacteria bacterium]|nr:hypothetical protein [Candidatus Kapabacteria bacterium]
MKKLIFLLVALISLIFNSRTIYATDCPPGTIQISVPIPDPNCNDAAAIVCIDCGSPTHPSSTFSLVGLFDPCSDNPDLGLYLTFISDFLRNNYPDICSGTWQPCDEFGTSGSVIYFDYPQCWTWINSTKLVPCGDARCVTCEVLCWDGNHLTQLSRTVTQEGTPSYECKTNPWSDPPPQNGTCFHIATECDQLK